MITFVKTLIPNKVPLTHMGLRTPVFGEVPNLVLTEWTCLFQVLPGVG